MARLLRWGWPEADAAATAARIEARHADDERRTCAECRHYRPSFHRCHNHRCAGLMAADIGRDLAGLHQRCPGFDEVQP